MQEDSPIAFGEVFWLTKKAYSHTVSSNYLLLGYIHSEVIMKMMLVVLGLLSGMTPTALHAQSTCPEKETLPIGTANQGGYRFDYYSSHGEQCRTYRLRNTPGKLQTPSEWKDSAEIFLSVDLPECGSGSTCPWTDAVRVSAVTKGQTALWYGANKDEFKESPDAFRLKSQAGNELSPFHTLIRGLVADAQGKVHRIAVEVSSHACAERLGGYTLVYKMELLGDSEPFRLLRLRSGDEDNTSLGLLWESAVSKPFVEYLAGGQPSELNEKTRALTVEVWARNLKIESSKLLAIYKGGKRIAATTAPAYVPEE